MKPETAQFYWSHIAGAKRVLDLGCAMGDLGKHKPHGVEVYGLELLPDLVKQASQYEHVREWDLDQAQPLPFDDATFDAVVAKDILEHLQKPWLTVREIRRVLRPGGQVMASVITPRGHRVWNDYTHVRGFTKQALRMMFTDAGFEVLKIWKMGGIPLSAKFNRINLVPIALRFPVFDWLWTSSYEIKARSRV